MLYTLKCCFLVAEGLFSNHFLSREPQWSALAQAWSVNLMAFCMSVERHCKGVFVKSQRLCVWIYVSAGLCGYSLRLAFVDSSSLTCEIDPCQSVCATDDQSAERQGNWGSSRFQLCQPAFTSVTHEPVSHVSDSHLPCSCLSYPLGWSPSSRIMDCLSVGCNLRCVTRAKVPNASKTWKCKWMLNFFFHQFVPTNF